MITIEQFDALDRPPTEQEIKDIYGLAITDHRFFGYPSIGWRGELCRQCWQYEIQHTILRTKEDIQSDRQIISEEIRTNKPI